MSRIRETIVPIIIFNAKFQKTLSWKTEFTNAEFQKKIQINHWKDVDG